MFVTQMRKTVVTTRVDKPRLFFSLCGDHRLLGLGDLGYSSRVEETNVIFFFYLNDKLIISEIA